MDQWADFVRIWVLGQDWLAFLHSVIVGAPDWVLAASAPVAVLIAIASILKGLRETAKSVAWGARGVVQISTIALDRCMAKRFREEYNQGFADGKARALSDMALQRTHEMAVKGQLNDKELSAYKKLTFSYIRGLDLDTGSTS